MKEVNWEHAKAYALHEQLWSSVIFWPMAFEEFMHFI